MLTLWDWKAEQTVLRSKAFSQDVFKVSFSTELEGQLTSSGTGHIRYNLWPSICASVCHWLPDCRAICLSRSYFPLVLVHREVYLWTSSYLSSNISIFTSACLSVWRPYYPLCLMSLMADGSAVTMISARTFSLPLCITTVCKYVHLLVCIYNVHHARFNIYCSLAYYGIINNKAVCG